MSKKKEIPEEKKEIEKTVPEKKETKKKKSPAHQTTALSVINTEELNHLIEEELDLGEREYQQKPKNHIGVHIFLVVLLFISLISFGCTLLQKNSSIHAILMSVLITIFTILYVSVGITYRRNSKTTLFVSGLLLLGYFILSFNQTFHFVGGTTTVLPDFTSKSITDVIEWAEKNKVTITQEYEYSDMIEEYKVISQDKKAGTNIKGVKDITISISEGPNPSKEIMVPSMLTWNSEKVLEFIKKNYLSNVIVEFEESDKEKDTVIEQSASGSLKRDDELKLIFSYGPEIPFEEVTLIDFTGKSQFEVEFYMKQHLLNYSFDYDFHKTMKKGYAIRQSISAGEVVPIQKDEVQVTISKGPEIKVPDLTKMDMTEIAEWAIENKVKISFEDAYDDTVKENHVIKANFEEGQIIEQGTIVKIVLSRGSLKMMKFDSLNEFYEWANKYEIPYEEVHEFHDSIPQGEVISYSYKVGEAIKNNDTIVVKISDGVKKSVPNVVGLSRKEAINKITAAGLKYSTYYRDNKAERDTVLAQSIRAGSEVSSGTTITLTLSSGKVEEEVKPPTPQPQPDPTPQCNKCSIYGIRNVVLDNLGGGYSAVEGAIRSHIQSQCPGIKINISGDDTSGKASGMILGNPEGEYTSCDTINIVLAK